MGWLGKLKEWEKSMCKKFDNFVTKLCGLAVEAKDLGLESEDHFNAILSDSYRSLRTPAGALDGFKTNSVVSLEEARAQHRTLR